MLQKELNAIFFCLSKCLNVKEVALKNSKAQRIFSIENKPVQTKIMFEAQTGRRVF